MAQKNRRVSKLIREKARESYDGYSLFTLTSTPSACGETAELVLANGRAGMALAYGRVEVELAGGQCSD